MIYRTIYDYLQQPPENVYYNQWRPGLDSNIKVEDEDDDMIKNVSEKNILLRVNYT